MFCLVLLEKNMHAQQNPSQDQEAGALNKTTTTGPRQRSPCLNWFRRWGPEANLPTSWARYGRSRVVSPHTSCRVTISIRGLNRLCQSSYVTARCCCPAPDCIWGIKRRFDICLDLNACALSYFWKERACDGSRCSLPCWLEIVSRKRPAAESPRWNRRLILIFSVEIKEKRKIHPRIQF